MKIYDPSTFTYGYEIEWGDIDRKFQVPKELGTWEFCEIDIVNLRPPYRGLGTDPQGVNPPVGGEINTMPTKTWQQQVDNIMLLKDLFTQHGTPPTSGIANHGHLHIHVPGLIEDIDALKRLMAYIKANQHDTMANTYQYKVMPGMEKTKTARTYLKHDGGRIAPDWWLDNLSTLPNSFEEWCDIACCGKDAKIRSRPFRYGIHTYALKNSKTVEFRCFRSTTERRELEDSFQFATKFMTSALNGGPSVKEIIAEKDWQFPPFIYDHEMYLSWEQTRKPKADRNLDKETAERLGLTKFGKSRKYIAI
jgi:hypothetical protein